MNRLARWMMRLYPARWRRRYGDELDALLADTGADARVVADLFQGGLRMQFSTWSFAKLAVVLGFAGALLGAAGSFLITPIYVSQATLRFTPALQQLQPMLLSRSSLTPIIRDPRLQLYKTDLKIMPFEDIIDEMRNNIRIDAIIPASALTISFQYPDPAKARQTVTALIGGFESESERMERAHPEDAGKHFLDVIDPPSLPAHPANPMGSKVVLTGVAVGLLFALASRMRRKTGFAARRFGAAAALFGMAAAWRGLRS